MIKIGRMVIGQVATNCYFLYNEEKHALVFDPADGGQMIYDKLTDAGFTVDGIFLTHGHFDHIFGTRILRQCSGAKLYAGEAEKELLNNTKLNVSAQVGRPYVIDADVYLKDGEEVTLAGMTLRCIFTPGHTAGSVSYYCEEAGLVICGDTLFQESVGRTDLPTGSEGTLIRSIRDRLFTLPDETVAYPGHGDSTTIEHEKKYNPFCC